MAHFSIFMMRAWRINDSENETIMKSNDFLHTEWALKLKTGQIYFVFNLGKSVKIDDNLTKTELSKLDLAIFK